MCVSELVLYWFYDTVSIWALFLALHFNGFRCERVIVEEEMIGLLSLVHEAYKTFLTVEK